MKNKENICYCNSPIGLLEITGGENYITGISFVEQKRFAGSEKVGVLKKCVEQLDEYFSGKRKKFDLPIYQEGTDFQRKVWSELGKIPFGSVASYGEVAEKTGNERASRAVGNANNKNNIPVIIPCHRVIGRNNSLTGYAGGLWRKEWLLDHEKPKN